VGLFTVILVEFADLSFDFLVDIAFTRTQSYLLMMLRYIDRKLTLQNLMQKLNTLNIVLSELA